MADVKHVPLVYTIGGLLFVLLVRFFYRGYLIRKRFHNISKLPHSWIWGHMKIVAECQASLPKDIPPGHVLYELARRHGLDDDYYILEPWPFGDPLVVSNNPEMSDQFTVQRSLPKMSHYRYFLEPVGGEHNLILDDGPAWKVWRSAFNPGFSNAHLMTLIPDFVDAIGTFRDILSELAKEGKPFRLEKRVTRLTLDVIGKVVLDAKLNCQNVDHPLVVAFEQTCRWLPLGKTWQPSEIWDIRRPIIFWKNTRTMNRLINDELTKRWQSRNERGKSKSIIDLTIETYMKEQGFKSGDNGELDPDFRKIAVNQVKMILFAGHDTTATTISYSLYYLAKHPAVAVKVRRELESVFGKDANIGSRIREEPTLINKLEYIMAVIKEALRLQPPSSSIRKGAKDFFITDPKTGDKIATDGIDLFASAQGSHLNKRWGDPFVFRPERWLEANKSGVLEGAWIPFSKSPRSCVGQEVALIEVRMTIAMVFRDFDFRACYDELDALRDDETGYTSKTIGEKELWGCEAFAQQMTSKPREGMPMRVYERKR